MVSKRKPIVSQEDFIVFDLNSRMLNNMKMNSVIFSWLLRVTLVVAFCPKILGGGRDL